MHDRLVAILVRTRNEKKLLTALARPFLALSMAAAGPSVGTTLEALRPEPLAGQEGRQAALAGWPRADLLHVRSPRDLLCGADALYVTAATRDSIAALTT